MLQSHKLSHVLAPTYDSSNHRNNADNRCNLQRLDQGEIRDLPYLGSGASYIEPFCLYSSLVRVCTRDWEYEFHGDDGWIRA